MAFLEYVQEWDGDIDELDAIGLDHCHIPCGDPECDCHEELPYVVLAIKRNGNNFQRTLIERCPDATSASEWADSFAETIQFEGEFHVSHGYSIIENIEYDQNQCVKERGAYHVEDRGNRNG